MVLSRIRSFRARNIRQVIPDVYQITVRGANVILIAEDELTLIDTGFRGSSSHIVSFIRGLGRSEGEIGLIIITHKHVDHAGGVDDLKRLSGAKVAAHQNDVGIKNFPVPTGIARRMMKISFFAGLHAAFSLPEDMVDIKLRGGEVLNPLGGLQVIHTPGHTDGSISLFSPRHKLLIVSDALNKGGNIPRLPPKMVTADMAKAIESARTISQLGAEIICFGHGRPLNVNASEKMQKMLSQIKY